MIAEGVKTQMTFQGLLRKIQNDTGIRFPEGAIVQLPLVISPKVQDEILSSGKSSLKLAHIFLNAIFQIDHGSVEKFETLIKRQL